MPRTTRLVVCVLVLTIGHAVHGHMQTPASKGTTALDVYTNGDRLELLVAEDQPAGQVLVHRRSTDTLTPQERKDLVAFLKNLTDEDFLTDPLLSNPWKK